MEANYGLLSVKQKADNVSAVRVHTDCNEEHKTSAPLKLMSLSSYDRITIGSLLFQIKTLLLRRFASNQPLSREE